VREGESHRPDVRLDPASSSVTRVISLSGNLAFGTVETGKTAELTFTIGNSGTGTLSVTGITVPGGYSPSWTSGTIGAGRIAAGDRQVPPTAAQRLRRHARRERGPHERDQHGGSHGDGAVPQPALATITGLAAEQGAGVLNEATIEIRDGPDARKWTTTECDGRFTLSGLQPGSVTVRASKSGYIDSDQRVALVAGGVRRD